MDAFSASDICFGRIRGSDERKPAVNCINIFEGGHRNWFIFNVKFTYVNAWISISRGHLRKVLLTKDCKHNISVNLLTC